MDRRRNPFVPGAGLQPPELAGRDLLLENASVDMDRILAGRPAKGLILLGLRGAGKTVLLNRLRTLADDKGFRTVRIEAPEGSSLPELLTPELRRILYALDLRRAAGHRLQRAASVLVNFARVFRVSAGDLELSVDLAPGEGDTGNLEQDLPRLLVAMAAAAADRHTAVGLFIDEVQYLSSSELAAVIVACHEIAQQNLPFLFIGAGLPQVAALAGKAKSYAERLFDYPEVGPLEYADARLALEKPARDEGVLFDGGAVDEILAGAQNFPYFIQEWGYQVWNAAPATPVTRSMVRDASAAVQLHLDSNFFRVRFDRLTPAGAEIPAGHGRAWARTQRHGPHRRDSGGPRSVGRRRAPAPHQQGNGVEPAPRRNGIHGTDVRRVHETPDAGTDQARGTAAVSPAIGGNFLKRQG